MGKVLAALAAALIVAACATPSRFEWGTYEGSLYAYAKKPENREKYRTSLQTAIENGEKSGRLAPGLHAELGYLFLEDGNEAEAASHFQKEMEAFPESRVFLTSVLTRLKGGASTNAPAAAAPGTPAS